MIESALSRNARIHPRRVQVVLRDHRVLEGLMHLSDGQFLASYLTGRKRYLNLTDVRWLTGGENASHIALQMSRILWVSSIQRDIPLMNIPLAALPRGVEVQIEGKVVMQAGLSLVSRQRLSDYLESAGEFIPLRDAQLAGAGRVLGDIAINQAAVQLVLETGRPVALTTQTALESPVVAISRTRAGSVVVEAAGPELVPAASR